MEKYINTKLKTKYVEFSLFNEIIYRLFGFLEDLGFGQSLLENPHRTLHAHVYQDPSQKTGEFDTVARGIYQHITVSGKQLIRDIVFS